MKATNVPYTLAGGKPRRPAVIQPCAGCIIGVCPESKKVDKRKTKKELKDTPLTSLILVLHEIADKLDDYAYDDTTLEQSKALIAAKGYVNDAAECILAAVRED